MLDVQKIFHYLHNFGFISIAQNAFRMKKDKEALAIHENLT